MLAVDGWPWESRCPGLWPGWREQELMPSASILHSRLFPIQSHVATCLPDQSCTALNPLRKSTEALCIPTAPQHQLSELLLVYSLMPTCPDRIDKIDYFRICQNVGLLCIFRSIKYNCQYTTAHQHQILY